MERSFATFLRQQIEAKKTFRITDISQVPDTSKIVLQIELLQSFIYDVTERFKGDQVPDIISRIDEQYRFNVSTVEGEITRCFAEKKQIPLHWTIRYNEALAELQYWKGLTHEYKQWCADFNPHQI